jgi:hypothetical protein
MYGGWGKDGPLQDLWEWDGRWVKIHDVTPTCGLGSAAPLLKSDPPYLVDLLEMAPAFP